MDIRVLEAQQWLNQTYGGDSRYGALLKEDGKPGTAVCEALVLGLQIELGMSNATGYFGDQTASAFTSQVGSLQLPTGVGGSLFPSRFVTLLQHGLYCKGYECYGVTGFFDEGTQWAVQDLQTDAGIAATGVVNAMVMKAVLNTDAYVVIGNGSADVRYIQQWLNRNYNGYFGLQSCDGLYGRGTNEALIYALQDEVGLGLIANGNFGPSTTNAVLTRGQISSTSTNATLIRIFKFSLYCNGYDSGIYNTSFNASTVSATESFQNFMKLQVTGRGDLNTWMSLLSSKGNPDRAAKACDCATQLTVPKIKALKNAGYETVGRYLTGTSAHGAKYITRTEAENILANGMNFFPILQQGGYYLDYFTYAQGQEDAIDAYNAAKRIGIPNGAIIYFAVDFDMMDHQVDSHVFPYFRGIHNAFGSDYKVGIYGSRNTCSRVGLNGYSVSSFVGDMSTGYSGNLGYTMPVDWAYDQFHEYSFTGSSDGNFDLDKNAKSSRAKPVTTLNSISTEVKYPKLPLSTSEFPGNLMHFYVNASTQTFNVYEKVAGGKFTNKIGSIKPNDMYASSGISKTKIDSAWYVQVQFRADSGKKALGFIKITVSLTDDLFAGQNYFHKYKVDGNSLIANQTQEINGVEYYVFTLSKDTVTDTGGVIKAGCKMGITTRNNDASESGKLKPYLMWVHILKESEYDWYYMGKYLDTKMELGVTPSTRLMK